MRALPSRLSTCKWSVCVPPPSPSLGDVLNGETIFIATEHDLAWPCGICRQVLNEFKAGDMRVVIGNTDGKWVEKNLSQLLPESFGPENLGLSEE